MTKPALHEWQSWPLHRTTTKQPRMTTKPLLLCHAFSPDLEHRDDRYRTRAMEHLAEHTPNGRK